MFYRVLIVAKHEAGVTEAIITQQSIENVKLNE